MFGVKLFLVVVVSLVLAGLSSRSEDTELLDTRVPSRVATGAPGGTP
jgi:hypothetical protein